MSTKIRWITMLLLMSVIILNACQQEETIGISAEMNGAPYRIVSVTELQTKLEAKGIFIVNVHTPWEGDIPQTDLRLAYDVLEEHLAPLPTEKDAKILVYCFTSGMAKQAMATLLAPGYTNIWMLEGGTSAWEEAGFTITK